MDDLLIACFILIGIFFVSCVIYFGGMTIQLKNDEQHKGELEYNDNSHEIKITTRNSYVASHIKINKEIQTLFKYNPSTITYTGVSVGGVSVGNFDVQKESLSTSSYNTGTYCLNHRKPWYPGDYNPIHSIALTDSLAEAAKQDSRVSKFLYENKLVLKGAGKAPSTVALEHYMKQGTLEASSKAMNILLSGATKSQLTKCECRDIKNWLAGEAFSPSSVSIDQIEKETRKNIQRILICAVVSITAVLLSLVTFGSYYGSISFVLKPLKYRYILAILIPCIILVIAFIARKNSSVLKLVAIICTVLLASQIVCIGVYAATFAALKGLISGFDAHQMLQIVTDWELYVNGVELGTDIIYIINRFKRGIDFSHDLLRATSGLFAVIPNIITSTTLWISSKRIK